MHNLKSLDVVFDVEKFAVPAFSLQVQLQISFMQKLEVIMFKKSDSPGMSVQCRKNLAT